MCAQFMHPNPASPMIIVMIRKSSFFSFSIPRHNHIFTQRLHLPARVGAEGVDEGLGGDVAGDAEVVADGFGGDAY